MEGNAKVTDKPKKPAQVATIPLKKLPSGVKIGDEVEVCVKGKLVFFEAGKRWEEAEEIAEVRIEIASTELTSGKNEFDDLLEDD